MTDRISYEQLDRLTAGKTPEVARTIEKIVRDANYAEEQIENKIRWIEDTVAQIRRRLADGHSLNDLGEFQRTPAEADMAIAARHQAWQTLRFLVGPEVAEQLSKREF